MKVSEGAFFRISVLKTPLTWVRLSIGSLITLELRGTLGFLASHRLSITDVGYASREHEEMY